MGINNDLLISLHERQPECIYFMPRFYEIHGRHNFRVRKVTVLGEKFEKNLGFCYISANLKSEYYIKRNKKVFRFNMFLFYCV